MPRVLAAPRRLILPTGMKGRASLRGDGVDDQVEGVFPPALAGAQPITAVGWFRCFGIGAGAAGADLYRTALFVGDAVAPVGRGLNLFTYSNTGTRPAWVWGVSAWDANDYSTFHAPIGQWQRVVVTHSGVAATPFSVYVDGQGPWNGAAHTPSWTAGGFRLFREFRPAPTYPWGGEASDVQVYNRVWTPAEVAADLRGERVSTTGLVRWQTCENPGYGTTCREEIGGTDDPITGAVWSPVVPLRRQRIVEDVPACFNHNAGARIVVSHHANLNPGTGEFGVMGWAWRPSRAAWRYLCGKSVGLAGQGWWLTQYSGTDTLYAELHDAVGGDLITSWPDLPLGGWFHFALTRQAGTAGIRLYIDAKRPRTAASNDRDLSSAANLQLGDAVSSGQWHGKTSDLCMRIGSAFTQDEIAANCYDGIWPVNLTGRWRERENAGTVIAEDAGAAGGPFTGTAEAASWSTATRCHARTIAAARTLAT